MLASTSVGGNTGLLATTISGMHYYNSVEKRTWFLHAGQELVGGRKPRRSR